MQHQAPPPGSRTLCELQCRLVTVPADERRALPGPAAPDALLTATADRQQHLAGYAPVVKCPSGQWPTCYDPADGAFTSGSGGTARGGLRPLLRQLVRCLPGGTAARLERALGLAEAASCGAPVAWHPQQPLLAAVDAGGRVQVFDYAGRVPALLGAGGGAGGPAPQALAPSALLAHELQHAPAALAWRPHGGKCLAVGAAQGVCLWHLGRPPPGSGSRSDSSAWMTWLSAPGAGTVVALAWHHEGRLLAGASSDAPGFQLWDVATGTAVPVAAGPEPVTLLRWSPCGCYLLAAHPGGEFEIWETQSWWSQRWAAAEGSGGELVEACWAPDSRSLLLAYENSPQLVSLHFTGEPPSLQAQLLPLPLAELSATGGAGASRQPLVRAIAWDPRGQRLAVALGGAHPAAGSAALFDTRCDPILTARFIGFLSLAPLPGSQPSRGPFAAGGGRAGAAAEAGWEEIQPEEVAEAAGAVGGGAGAPAAARRGGGHPAAGAPAGAENRPQLAFLPGFRQGAVLAARLGDRVAAIPMYYA
ncbi:transducin WD40 repeat [Micractinium conductrix]|uniref:Transducin WD40 repeat n=1 Tax=Micractinium conductrix TaxID=554055 RepID=A0A2P6VPL5_9CHLO|nr:transducin WD40 repeat [Micractinium conductrix]|eukprot:PSC76031.1 transducin WD40 repeat [Micractinium conductrix]